LRGEKKEIQTVAMPKKPLKISASMPVLGGAALAAVWAAAHVAFAVASAPQELTRVSQMACVMIEMAWAEPWLKEDLSTGWKLVSLRLSKPTPNSIWGMVHLPVGHMSGGGENGI
jgi:hypothetical protein